MTNNLQSTCTCGSVCTQENSRDQQERAGATAAQSCACTPVCLCGASCNCGR